MYLSLLSRFEIEMNKEKRNNLPASNQSEPPFINRSGTYVVEENAKSPRRENGYELPRIDNVNSRTVTSNRSLNLSILKQTKRAELLKQSNSEDVVVFGPSRTHDFKHVIRNARKSGLLNLSSQDIVEVPMSVWRIDADRGQDEEKESKTRSVSFDKPDQDESKWWTYVELNKLILASNKIRVIPREVNMLSSLTVLDVIIAIFNLCCTFITCVLFIEIFFSRCITMSWKR